MLYRNDVVLIGGNHHNMLGIIRSLGKNNIKSNLIITDDKKYSFVSKSRYVNEYEIIPENEELVLKCIEKYKNSVPKKLLIPTSDFAEYVIDKNLHELKKHFLVPSIDKTEGNVVKYMDKILQYDLCKKYNIKMAKTINLNLNEIEDCLKEIKKLSFPCILKPELSIDGKKSDIRICNEYDEVKSTLIEFKHKNN